MIYFVDSLLWVIALGLGLIAASRSRTLFRTSVREGAVDCVRLLPRIMLGVVGSGYIAALLPQEVVGRWLGADSGVTGMCIAVLGGAFTVFLAGLGTAAFMAGGSPQQPEPEPHVTPAVDVYVLQHDLVTGEVPAQPSHSVVDQHGGGIGLRISPNGP